jgi:RNA polymerase sigma factor (sigma-70 family)
MNYTLDKLSEREKEVLLLITQGNTNRKVGEVLEITESTVETHRKHIKKKLKARHTADLCKIALINNLF